MKDRVDKIMLAKSLVSTRSQATGLIKEGVVYIDDIKVDRPSLKIDESANIEIRKEHIYVGRGAHKIEGALEIFDVDTKGLIIADVGASTGGFTDYVLNRGNAKKVYAIDVGHDQLADKLINDDRVINLEGVNIKFPLELDEKVDLCVVDLSYISLEKTLKNIADLTQAKGKIIALVKPQFEIGKEKLGKNGIVKNKEDHQFVLQKLFDFCQDQKLYVQNACKSPILGKTGNSEYFFYINKELSSHGIDSSFFETIL